MPGRPARPRLVHPRDLPRRGLGTPEGRAAFIHSIAHIEFNAIVLGWAAVYRFRGMPAAFYADWVSVASDEARHFTMLRERLRESGDRQSVVSGKRVSVRVDPGGPRPIKK